MVFCTQLDMITSGNKNFKLIDATSSFFSLKKRIKFRIFCIRDNFKQILYMKEVVLYASVCHIVRRK